ncbi:restriction endonuclease subunit S [Pseudomonas sp. SP16.1]|uniref:restriction endonuclease subunit S n=1 Tax=Pseudomonas sp. SP16.1 TaxID=3458854 RepID=UPI0040453181
MSSEAALGYKLTEAGLIPLVWDALPLKETLIRGRLGGNYGNSERETSAPLMKMGNINRGIFSLDKIEYIQDIDSIDPSHKLNKGDVLFNTRNTLELVGKVAIWRDELPIAYYNSNLMRLEFDQRKIASTEYANYALNSISSIARLKAIATGTTSVAAIYTRDLLVFCMPVPPKKEQVAIGNALSDIDSLISGLDQLIAKKRDVQQAAMQQLLTGQHRLPGFSGKLEIKRLGDIANLYQPVTISAKQFTESGYPVYGANGVVGFFPEFNHDTCQVTVTCRGSTCGTVNRTVEKSWITGNAMVVNCDQSSGINKNFLYFLLLGQDLSVCITGTGQPQIVRGTLASFELLIPSDLEEQIAIATILSDMGSELTTLEARRNKAFQVKQGMMQELLTGRIRLA